MDTVLYLFLVYAISYFGIDRFLRAKGYRGQVREHFDGKRFHNIGNGTFAPSLKRPSFLKWVLQRPKNDWVWKDNRQVAKPKERIHGGELVVTFINHATLLIQTEGLNILTDPVWSQRVSPTQWLGPKRYRAPGVVFDDLPPIDVVLISHNHYDHMDIPTLRRIVKRWHPKIYVGLGNASYLSRKGIDAEDMDWNETRTLRGENTLHCVSAQHFSSRALSDRDKTLWCGFVIDTPHGAIYFAGDTGYGEFLDTIKAQYRAFRLALLPIGAYLPQFFMQRVHMSPEEAYHAAKELRVNTMIPIHYATFRLADDRQEQPELALRSVIESDSTTKVVILENGDSATIL